jgi:hypothetical protein
MSADFTLAGYGALLDALTQRGYGARQYGEADPAQRHLVLRHDIDMSITAAVAIAEVEQARGLSATYFVLVRTEMYNPFSRASLRDLRHIVSLGHALGLHLDASIYPDRQSLEAGAAAECAGMESLVETPISVISFHRPTSELHGDPRPIAGRPHAYQPRFFREMGYCSDSRGAWMHGHPLDHPAVSEGRALQLLTHPIWWASHGRETPREKLDRFALRRFDLLRAELARNCQSYPQQFADLAPESAPNG